MMPLSEIASFVAIAIANLLLVGTLISIAVFITLRLTRDLPPRLRHVFLVISFAAATVIPFFIALRPTEQASRPSEVTNSPVVVMPVNQPSQQTVEPEERPLNESTALRTTLWQTVERAAHRLSDPNVSMFLFIVWLIGAGLLLGKEVTALLFIARARRRWRPAGRLMKMRLSWPANLPLAIDDEFGPCAVGIVRPIVVMPAQLVEDLDPQAAQQVARHELDHLKWHDPLMNTLMRITRACFWPSLPLWYLNSAASLEREAAADRAAVAIAYQSQPDLATLEYASTLLSIARKRAAENVGHHYTFAATDLGRPPGLNDRVKRLMAARASRPARINLLLASATLITSIFTLTVVPVVKVQSHSETQTSNNVSINNLQNSSGSVVENHRGSVNVAFITEAKPEPDQPTSVIDASGEAPSVATESADLNVPADPDTQDFESEMAAVGYKNLTPKQIADMEAYAVGPGYVAEMAKAGYSGLSADMLIRFKWLAVSTSYIEEMKSLGYGNLSASTLAEFRQQSVSSDFIRKMRTLVSGPISAEQLVSLRFYGASPEFIGQLKALGYETVNADQLISMRLQNVNVSYIREMKSRSARDLSVDELIGMRMRRNN